jgi:hypothetical protein
MNVRQMGSGAILWFTLALAACTGGSGSSGFDIFPTENAAIEQALDERRCVEREGLAICPADAEPVGVPSTPGIPGLQIDFVVETAMLRCSLDALRANCSSALAFVASGFPPDTRFRLALRRFDADAEWTVGPELSPGGEPATPLFDAPVNLETDPRSATGISAQAAVLVFLEPREPIPGLVRELAETAADYAFVTGEITLLPEIAVSGSEGSKTGALAAVRRGGAG